MMNYENDMFDQYKNGLKVAKTKGSREPHHVAHYKVESHVVKIA
jgi:hypothetical protein